MTTDASVAALHRATAKQQPQGPDGTDLRGVSFSALGDCLNAMRTAYRERERELCGQYLAGKLTLDALRHRLLVAEKKYRAFMDC